jgi:hypothetical protein
VSTVETVNGDMSIIGTGGGTAASQQDLGVNVSPSAGTGIFKATGSGNVTITGTGGPGTGNCCEDGIYALDGSDSGNTAFSTNSGALTLNGTGGGGGGSSYNRGIVLWGATATSNAGNVLITGTGGTGGGGGHRGIQFYQGGEVTSTSGNITLTGIGNGDSGILISNTGNNGNNVLGGAGDSGNITLISDTLALSELTAQTSGNVTFKPYTANTTVGVAGGAGTLGISTGILGSVTAGSITIGAAADSGAMTVNAYNWASDLTLQTGSGVITVNGAQALGSHAMTIQTDATPTLNAGITSTGTVTVEPTTAGTTIGVAGGAGTLQVTSGTLGNVTADTTIIGASTDTGLMTVAAADLSGTNYALSLLNGSGGITINGALGMGANTFYANTASGNLTLGSGAGVTSTAAGNAIVVAAGGNFVNNSGSNAPFTANNGRFIGYSHKKANDTNPVTDQQEITGFDYNGLPPSSIVAPTYNGSQNTWVYDVASGTITLTAVNQTVTYGTAPNTTAQLGVTFTFSCSDGCSSSVLTGNPGISIGGATSTSGDFIAGNHTISLAGATDNNGYTINYLTGTLTVNTKGLTISGMTANNKVYDATTAATLNHGSDTLNGVVTNDVVSFDTSGATGTFADKNVGNGKTVTASGITLGGADAANYTLTQPTAAANITARAITVTADAQSDTYGDTLGALTYNLTGGALQGADSFAGALTTAHGGAGTVLKHANGFDVSGSPFAITQGTLSVNDGNSGGNYAITYNSANLTLAAKGITITGFAAANKVYDGTTAASITSDGSLSGVVAGDTVSINNAGASASFDTKHVGNGKTVTASGYALTGAQAGDYTLSAQPTTTASITPAGLTITASNQTKTYASDNLGNSAFTSGGLKNGETIGSVTLSAVDINSLGLSTSGNHNVGTWGITPSNAAGGSFTPSDYSITYATTGRLTINPLALTITGLSGTNKVYDGTAGDSITGSPTLNTVVLGDVVNLNNGTASFANKNVGNGKTVTFSGYTISGADAGDYALSQPANSTANITARAITVTAQSNTKTYDGTVSAAAAPTITAGSLAAGDTASWSETYDTKHVGNGKTLTPSGSVSDGNAGSNYAVTFVNNNTGVINPAGLSVTADNKIKQYGNPDPAFTYSIGGLVGGDTGSGVLSGALARDPGENVGNYAIKQGTLSSTSDYTLAFTPGNLNIAAAVKAPSFSVPPAADEWEVQLASLTPLEPAEREAARGILFVHAAVLKSAGIGEDDPNRWWDAVLH